MQASSKAVESRLPKCSGACITIQMLKVIDMGAAGLDAYHAGF